MQHLLQFGLSNAVAAAVLAVLAAVATRVWRNPHFAYALWLVVLLRLVAPPLLPVGVPVPEWMARLICATRIRRAAAWARSESRGTPDVGGPIEMAYPESSRGIARRVEAEDTPVCGHRFRSRVAGANPSWRAADSRVRDPCARLDVPEDRWGPRLECRPTTAGSSDAGARKPRDTRRLPASRWPVDGQPRRRRVVELERCVICC